MCVTVCMFVFPLLALLISELCWCMPQHMRWGVCVYTCVCVLRIVLCMLSMSMICMRQCVGLHCVTVSVIVEGLCMTMSISVCFCLSVLYFYFLSVLDICISIYICMYVCVKYVSTAMYHYCVLCISVLHVCQCCVDLCQYIAHKGVYSVKCVPT